MNIGTPELTQYLADQIKFFKENAKQVIKDYGPKAIELLYKGAGPFNKDGVPESYPEISIENMLNTARTELQNVISKTVTRPELSKKFMEFITKAGLTKWKETFRMQFSMK